MRTTKLLGLGIVLALILPIALAATESHGPYHSLEIRDGEVWAMGRGDFGQLGTNGTSYEWVRVPRISNAVSVAAGNLHSLVLTNDGTVYGFGQNTFGQITDSGVTFYREPTVLYHGATGINTSGTLTMIETAEGVRLQGEDSQGIVGGRRHLSDPPIPKATIADRLKEIRTPVATPQTEGECGGPGQDPCPPPLPPPNTIESSSLQGLMDQIAALTARLLSLETRLSSLEAENAILRAGNTSMEGAIQQSEHGIVITLR